MITKLFAVLSFLAAPASTYVVGNTIEYNEPRWEDLRFPATLLTVPPGLAPFGTPDLLQFPIGGSTNTYTRCMDPDSDEGLLLTVQLPHARKDDSDLSPHVHWSPATTDTGNVVWQLECTGITDIDETFAGTANITMTDAGDGVVNKHQLISNGVIAGGTSTISSMLVCSLYRDADNGSDSFTGDACLLEVDFHVRIDNPGGSSSESSK